MSQKKKNRIGCSVWMLKNTSTHLQQFCRNVNCQLKANLKKGENMLMQQDTYILIPFPRNLNEKCSP